MASRATQGLRQVAVSKDQAAVVRAQRRSIGIFRAIDFMPMRFSNLGVSKWMKRVVDLVVGAGSIPTANSLAGFSVLLSNVLARRSPTMKPTLSPGFSG